jgi:hypothetical protein
VEGTGAETTIGGKNNFVANNIKDDFYTFRAICKWSSLVVVMINTTVTL